MARVILGVTGSVAAIRTPVLERQLRAAGHEVRVVATEPALYFFQPGELIEPGCVYRDADEWPGAVYERTADVLHIEFRKWADVLVVAPVDANTLGKFALGLCDNFLSCVFRAWDFEKPVILAPAMNTMMWESPVTRRHFRQLLEDHGDGRAPEGWGLEGVAEIFAQHGRRIRVVAPQSKRLACGDVGMGAMAEVESIVALVAREWAED